MRLCGIELSGYVVLVWYAFSIVWFDLSVEKSGIVWYGSGIVWCSVIIGKYERYNVMCSNVVSLRYGFGIWYGDQVEESGIVLCDHVALI